MEISVRQNGSLSFIGGDYRWGNMNQQYLAISSFGPYSNNFDDTSMHRPHFTGPCSLVPSVKIKCRNWRELINIPAMGNPYTFNPSFYY
jgi:hypothetical protein